MPSNEIAGLSWGLVTDDQGNGLAGRLVKIVSVRGGVVHEVENVETPFVGDIFTRQDGTIPHYITPGVADVFVAGEATRVQIGSGEMLAGGALQLPERPAKVTPLANNVALQARDNGLGKTQLVAVWPDGTELILGTQA